MPITSDEVKSLVYEQIDEIGKEKIRGILSSGHGEEYLSEIVSTCQQKVRNMGGDADAERAMLTTILHFSLSLAAVPSHRKVVHDGLELDVVIPDLRTLQKSPESALVMCIIGGEIGKEWIESVKGVLDSKARLVVALFPSAKGMDHTSYSVDDSTFPNVIRDMREFLASSRRANFGMIT